MSERQFIEQAVLRLAKDMNSPTESVPPSLVNKIQAYSGTYEQVHWISIGSRRTIKGTSDWTTYALRLRNLSDDIRYVYVYLIFSSGSLGTVYFDDISLAVLD